MSALGMPWKMFFKDLACIIVGGMGLGGLVSGAIAWFTYVEEDEPLDPHPSLGADAYALVVARTPDVVPLPHRQRESQ